MVFVEAPLVVQYRLAPGLEDDLQIFPEPVAQLIERNAKRQSLPFDEAVADPKLESASAQAVERGIVLGKPQRVMIREQDYGSADPNPGGPLRNRCADNRCGRKEPAERMKVMFRKPDRIEAELFRIPRLLHDSAQALAPFSSSARKRRRQIKQPVAHGGAIVRHEADVNLTNLLNPRPTVM